MEGLLVVESNEVLEEKIWKKKLLDFQALICRRQRSSEEHERNGITRKEEGFYIFLICDNIVVSDNDIFIFFKL